MERSPEFVSRFPYAYSCDCGRPRLVESRDAGKVIACAACGAQRGPFAIGEANNEPPAAKTVEAESSVTEINGADEATFRTPKTERRGPSLASRLPRPVRVAIGWLFVKGGLVVMAGAGMVFLAASGFGSQRPANMPLAIAGVVVGVAASFAQYAGKLLAAPLADELERLDPRSPVLLLRVFDDDSITKNWTFHRDPTDGMQYMPAFGQELVSFEELIAEITEFFGPLVAIGRPGELVAPAGAARRWVVDDSWQERVQRDVERSAYVIMIMGDLDNHPGTAWEWEELTTRGMLKKVILLMPPISAEDARTRWTQYQSSSRGLLPAFQGGELAAGFDADGHATVIRDNDEFLRDAADRYRNAIASLMTPRARVFRPWWFSPEKQGPSTVEEVDSVPALVVRGNAMKVIPLPGRLFLMLIPAGVVAGMLQSDQPLLAVPMGLAWLGLLGYGWSRVTRPRILRADANAIQIGYITKTRRLAWSDVAMIGYSNNNLGGPASRHLVISVTAGAGRNIGVPQWYFSDCHPATMAAALRRFQKQSLRSIAAPG